MKIKNLVNFSFSLLLCLLVSIKVSGQAPNIKFEHISLQHGLSQSSIHAILQDKKGFMWFGTLDGLNKYDGYNFKTYRHKQDDSLTLADNSIKTIYQAKDGNMWIGTRTAGISRLDIITETFSHLQHNPDNNNSLCSNTVNAIYQDWRGIMWIATNKGLDSYNTHKQKFSHFTADLHDTSKLNNNNIHDIIGDTKGNLWIANDLGLSKMSFYNEKFTHYELKMPNEDKSSRPAKAMDLMIDSKENIWIGTNKGLFHLNTNTNEIKSYHYQEEKLNSLSGNFINDIVEDHEGIIWIATQKKGLNRLDPKTGEISQYYHDPAQQKSLTVNNLLTLYHDKSNILWVGTSLGGINKWNRAAEDLNVFRHNPYLPYSLSSNQVRSIFEDKNGVIWIGTVDGGLNRWNEQENKFIHYKTNKNKSNTISHNHIRTIVQDKTGIFWIGTDGGGLNRFDPKTEQFVVYKQKQNTTNCLSNNHIWDIIEDDEGLLWIATMNGLTVFDPVKENFTQFFHNPNDTTSLSHNKVTCLFQDKNKVIWIGTMGGGLDRWHPESKSFSSYKHIPGNNKSLGNNRVYSIMEDSKGSLWIGTKGSLNKFNRKSETFTHFDEDNGFPNDVFMGVLEDKQGFLWTSTNNGLSKFNTITGEIRNYDMRDGLQSNEFLVGSYCKAADGQLFFGGINGFNAFYPERIKDNPHRPEIVITGFYLFSNDVELDTSISEKKYLELSYQEDVISFDFVALDYIFPEKNEYAYMLEGYDNDWIPHGNRHYVTYTNVPPGHYVFKVKGSNSDGVWNEKGTSIRLTITPPFWQTTWFYILLVLVILAIIYLYIKWRERKLMYDKKLLEETVEERTREIRKQKDEIEQQRDEIQEQKDQIEQQHKVVKKQNVKIKESIHYASRIQNAVLPPDQLMDDFLPEHFVYFKPRDIVSGDYYWVTKKKNKIIIVAADCTGHGVPGAFMSLLGISFLNEIVNKNNLLNAAEILNQMRKNVKKSLHQTGKKAETKDGMDMALCIIDKEQSSLQFAGANNPLFLIRDNELQHIKPDRMPIGIFKKEKDSFTNHEKEIINGDRIYMFSDGYIDQFGGDKGRKFLTKRFKQLLLDIHKLPMKKQKEVLNEKMEQWQGQTYNQIDDMLVLGMVI